jgi:hypothetical protein
MQRFLGRPIRFPVSKGLDAGGKTRYDPDADVKK